MREHICGRERFTKCHSYVPIQFPFLVTVIVDPGPAPVGVGSDVKREEEESEDQVIVDRGR